MPARWEMKETDTALLLAIAPKLLKQVADESGFKTNGLEIRNRFQIRDPQIEHIGWALQAEVEQGYPSGNLYMESMAIALAVQLLHRHSSVANVRSLPIGGLSPQKLRQVLSFIEDNLRQDLALQTIAEVAGLSVSHLKVLFRRSAGIPVHQYVIRRRVDRAVLLLRQGKLSISEIALETGFAHQSHLAMHMRRILGVTPSHFNRFSA
jgi:AraC family transcriptional regulator